MAKMSVSCVAAALVAGCLGAGGALTIAQNTATTVAGTVVADEVLSPLADRVLGDKPQTPEQPTVDPKTDQCETLRDQVIGHIDVEQDAADMQETFAERFPNAVKQARYKAHRAQAQRKIAQRMAVEIDCRWALPRRR